MDESEKPPMLEYCGARGVLGMRLERWGRISRIVIMIALWVGATAVAGYFFGRVEVWLFRAGAGFLRVPEGVVWAWEPRVWGSGFAIALIGVSMLFGRIFRGRRIAVIRREGERDILLANVNVHRQWEVDFANEAIGHAWEEMRGSGKKVVVLVQRGKAPLQAFDGESARGVRAIIVMPVGGASQTPRLES